MKSRPILFSAPMVRAILAGTKTQTRRIMKPQPAWVYGERVPVRTADADPKGAIRCPYGQPGDRLWVRETVSESDPCFLGGRAQPTVWYRADNNRPTWAERKWTPSIHCARRLSRITLEITGVRVERHQDIGEVGAMAEGVETCPIQGWRNYLWHGDPNARTRSVNGWPHQFSNYLEARGSFSSLWESINGPGSWAANPWAWVVEFKRVQP